MKPLADLKPLDYYTSYLKDRFRSNAEERFDALVRQSGVDVQANKEAAARCKAAIDRAAAAKKHLESGKSTRGLLIFFIVLLLLAGLILICAAAANGWNGWLIAFSILCFAASIPLFVIIFTVVREMVDSRQKQYDEDRAAADAQRQECIGGLRPLQALLTRSITRELVHMTEPDLRLDPCLDVKKLDLMVRKYGFAKETDRNSSTLFVLSGTMEESPFLYVRTLRHAVYNKTYTGSVVIHWTTYETDSEGETHAVHHSQTLVAHHVAPAPSYTAETRLYYGNEAAPDLTFSRTPGHVHRMEEGEIERKIRRGKRSLERKARRAVAEGKGNFTAMANVEFDTLFGAVDRNNEVQFRLLFTPLAQQNMVALLRSAETYGDDFAFYKKGMLNCIRSEHMQFRQPEPDPSNYVHYDLEQARTAFLSYNERYFRSVYFDLAPLLAIPVYRMQKPREFLYRDVYPSNYTGYETESLANRFSVREFAHEKTKTQTILKTGFVQKDGASDKVRVDAYSYDAIPRVAVYTVLGGDGNFHSVPVNWTEYIPLTRTSLMEVKEVGGSREEYERACASEPFRNFASRFRGTTAFRSGLIGFALGDALFDSSCDKEFEKLYASHTKQEGEPA